MIRANLQTDFHIENTRLANAARARENRYIASQAPLVERLKVNAARCLKRAANLPKNALDKKKIEIEAKLCLKIFQDSREEKLQQSLLSKISFQTSHAEKIRHIDSLITKIPGLNFGMQDGAPNNADGTKEVQESSDCVLVRGTRAF